jgi:hypothetical protein
MKEHKRRCLLDIQTQAVAFGMVSPSDSGLFLEDFLTAGLCPGEMGSKIEDPGWEEGGAVPDFIWFEHNACWARQCSRSGKTVRTACC